jgi:ADP-ribose pyrophosphatase
MAASVHAQRQVFDGFLKVVEAEVSFERFDGTMSRPVKRLSVERGDSAAAIVYDRDAHCVILVEQFKYPTLGHGSGWIVETVAGVVEEGERPETTIRREILEEIGYRIDSLEPIATFYVSPGGSSERVFLYYAEVSGGDRVSSGGGVASEDEDIRAVVLRVADLDRLVAEGALEDAKTLLGILWFQARAATRSA